MTKLPHFLALQFADGDQHDSQEALRIIMEALDVDCSRVKTPPPYRELASTGAPPGRLARDAWSYHWSRHDSVIQDIFSGEMGIPDFVTFLAEFCNSVSSLSVALMVSDITHSNRGSV
jgi:hypothetical protein